jgi:hypothetical protein
MSNKAGNTWIRDFWNATMLLCVVLMVAGLNSLANISSNPADVSDFDTRDVVEGEVSDMSDEEVNVITAAVMGSAAKCYGGYDGAGPDVEDLENALANFEKLDETELPVFERLSTNYDLMQSCMEADLAEFFNTTVYVGKVNTRNIAAKYAAEAALRDARQSGKLSSDELGRAEQAITRRVQAITQS